MLGLSYLVDIHSFSSLFWVITGCGSASLKLCVCNAASPWSQSPSPDSQCTIDKIQNQKHLIKDLP